MIFAFYLFEGVKINKVPDSPILWTTEIDFKVVHPREDPESRNPCDQ